MPSSPGINVYLSDNDSYDITVDEENDINIRIPHTEVVNINDYFKNLLDQLSFSVNCFSSAATLNQKLNKISWEIQRVTDNITANYKKLLDLNWKNLKQKLELMHNIRCSSLEIQVLSNEFTNAELKLKSEKELFNPRSSEPWNDNFFQNYFYNYFKVPPISLKETRETIKYLNEIISNKYMHYYTICAALIGGMIGAIITQIPSALSFIYNSLLLLGGKQ